MELISGLVIRISVNLAIGGDGQVESPEACAGRPCAGEGDVAIVLDGDGAGGEMCRASMVT